MGCKSSKPKAEAPKVETPKLKPATATELHNLLKRSSTRADAVRAVLARTPNGLSLRDSELGNYPLHTVAQFGNLELLKLFIEFKADVNSKNMDGNTPLHMALGYDHFDCAIQLKISGADDSIENKDGFPARKGIDGTKSYGVAAIASSTTIKQLDIAFKICDSSVGDINEDALLEACDKAKEVIGDKWTEDYTRRLANLIAQFNTDNVKVVLDDSRLSCVPKGGFRTLFQCNGV